MTQLDYSGVLAAMDAQLVGETEADLRVGRVLRSQLAGRGATYDSLYTAAADASRDAAHAAYTSALAAWSGAYATRFGQFDAVAKACEAEQVTANATSATPYLAPDGSVLAPTTSIAVEAVEPSPVTTASIMLSGTLYLAATDPGVWGNTATAAVADATSSDPARFKLTLARGSYSEVYDELEASSPVTGSKLVQAAVWLGTPARPSNAGAASLTGGTGGGSSRLHARLQAAVKLPDITDETRAVAERYVAELATLRGGQPTKSNGDFDRTFWNGARLPQSLQAYEDDLQQAIDDATAWLAIA